MIYSLHIPKWQPARLNAFVGRHWSVMAAAKKRDREMVCMYALQSGIPKATCKRRVSLSITLKGRQKPSDPDSMWKSCLDSLVAAGLIVDDSGKWVELGGVHFFRGDFNTVIVLEDLDR